MTMAFVIWLATCESRAIAAWSSRRAIWVR